MFFFQMMHPPNSCIRNMPPAYQCLLVEILKRLQRLAIGNWTWNLLSANTMCSLQPGHHLPQNSCAYPYHLHLSNKSSSNTLSNVLKKSRHIRSITFSCLENKLSYQRKLSDWLGTYKSDKSALLFTKIMFNIHVSVTHPSKISPESFHTAQNT